MMLLFYVLLSSFLRATVPTTATTAEVDVLAKAVADATQEIEVLGKEMFKPSKFRMDHFRLEDYSDLTPFLWANILAHLDGSDLLEMSYVSKFFNVLIHNKKIGFLQRLQTAKNLLAVLLSTTRDISLPEAQFVGKYYGYFSVEVMRAFLRGVPHRTKEPKTIQHLLWTAFEKKGRPYNRAISATAFLPTTVLDDVYQIKGILKKEVRLEKHAYYISGDPTELVFEEFDLQTEILPTMLTITEEGLDFSEFFIPAIVAQYILPEWRAERKMTKKELATVKAIASVCGPSFATYFQNVFDALFLETGKVNLSSCPRTEALGKFLSKRLGFNWIRIHERYPHEESYKTSSSKGWLNYKNIYLVAQHWDFDREKITSAFPKTDACKAILANHLYLAANKNVTPMAVLESFADRLIRPHSRPGKIVKVEFEIEETEQAEQFGQAGDDHFGILDEIDGAEQETEIKSNKRPADALLDEPASKAPRLEHNSDNAVIEISDDERY